SISIKFEAYLTPLKSNLLNYIRILTSLRIRRLGVRILRGAPPFSSEISQLAPGGAVPIRSEMLNALDSGLSGHHHGLIDVQVRRVGGGLLQRLDRHPD